MASEWRKSTVGEEANILLGYAFKGSGFLDRGPGVRLLRGDNVKRGAIEWGEKSRYWPNVDTGLERYQLKAGDIVIGMDGSRVGENFACVSDADLPALLVQRVACLRAKAAVLQPYLRYLVCNPSFTSYVKSIHTGTSIPHISGKQIASFEIVVPPASIQEGLSSLLCSLDDRIDLLRSVNKTIEDIAQALFKSWFMNFDPVRAKAEGREPEGLDAATAALFPSEFEDSELGPIPKGWRAQTLAELSDLNASKWTARGHPEQVKYVDLSGVHQNHIEQITDFCFSEAPSRARHHLRDGDTIIGTVRPGNRAYAYIHAPEPNMTGSTGFAVLSPKTQNVSSFIYLAATSDGNIERLAKLADGGAYPAIRPSVVAETPCVIGPDDIVSRFSELTKPMLETIGENSSRAATLGVIRDTLLLRLISGKLRLPDATEICKASVENYFPEPVQVMA